MTSDRRADGDGDGDGHGGYVHRPSGEPAAPDADRRFDWRGWVLVATIAFSFLVVPGLILLSPEYASSLGLSFWDTYLVLPLLPALLLGVVAVWSAVRSRGA